MTVAKKSTPPAREPYAYLPDDMLSRHIAILGSTGSGKTSVAKSGIVEPQLSAGARVVVIDPTGAWWGLRLDANGKGEGFPVYIFGGDHGDHPLRAKDAALLADAFGTSSGSAVFDTSLMTVADRTAFFTDFANTILRKNRGPLHLVIDEAHLFMPQAGAKSGGAVPAMLHAGNNLVSLGRSKGLRITMITQRPAKLHKDSLTQAQSLIAMRVLHPLDRKAITDWIAEVSDDPRKGDDLVRSLSGLKAGEAWVWAPLSGMLERFQFPMPQTYDSSRAPDGGSDGPALAPINMDALKGKLATVEAETKANDPKALRAEISRLKSESGKRIVADPATIESARQAAHREGFDLGYDRGVKDCKADLDHFADVLASLNATVQSAMTRANMRLASVSAPPPAKPAPTTAMSIARPAPTVRAENASAGPLSPSARAILDVLHKLYPVSLSFDAAARRAGISKRSSAYRKYRTEVMGAGETEEAGDNLRSKPEFAASEPVPSGAAVSAWVARLPPSYGKMLQAIADGHETKDAIAEASGVSPTSSGLGAGLRELLDLELIVRSGERYELAEGLA